MIYQQGLDTKLASFQEKAPRWSEWDEGHNSVCRFVATVNERVVGWIALSPVSKREVYKGVAELSVYVNTQFSGQGIGSILMTTLLVEAKREGFWTKQSSVFPENKGSLSLHMKHGFRKVGVREKIGQLNGIWRDTILLEKRFPSQHHDNVKHFTNM
ncbi:GNAT family N-acetyltransferase [Alkalihalobacillus pseudalcaliphilus]|uniref:GNAT family N-acetyltransferase n=1 Tax=Alkalihalobacillus pseudalcaliphilus TaxID=79884 RepID=UPI00064D7742|nr:GNAT family N-acetyltransferase [Alkalihalobacillus pseudalcaliphilus]KMK76935.1 phosphinothricin acetyltransferase [Alkalihalobacillus pseudalcaliphilus]